MLQDSQYKFKLIKFKNRRRRGFKTSPDKLQINDDIQISVEEVLRNLNAARVTLKSSEQIIVFIENIKFGTQVLNVHNHSNEWVELVCYGIGKFSTCSQALHQLALLLELKAFYKIVVNLYDPLLSKIEKEILKTLELNILEVNEEGKRKVNGVTIFFLPHCPRHLFNNLLWSNWGPSLSNCVIIGNKHSDAITNCTRKMLNKFWYLKKITPALVEFEIPNVYRYQDVFNDLAVHVFPPEKLNTIPTEIWKIQKVPIYSENDEFIQNST